MVTSNLTGFRLSPQQEGVWRAQGSRPAPGFVCQGQLALRGPLDRDRLRRAVEQVVERHEILRTSFRQLAGMALPIQVIQDRGTVLWSEPEASGSGAFDPARHLAEARRSPGLPEEGAALQAALVSLGDERHALLLTLPGLAVDAASLRILAHEIAALYDGQEGGGEALPEPLQYADAAESLQEWLGAEDGPGAAFWRQHGSPLHLPPEAAGHAVPETERRRLPGDPVAALARQEEVPVPLLLLAAWSAALWWETGEERPTIAVAHDGRTVDDLTGAVGLYARHLPVRSEAGPALTLGELARHLEGAMTTAAAWQDAFSLDRLAAGPPGAGSVPVWPYGFDSDRTTVLSPSASLRPAFVGLGRFDRRLSVLEEATAIDLDLHYDPSRLDRAHAVRLLDRLERVLRAAGRKLPLGEMEVLTEAERRELLIERNDTAAPYPREATVADLFEERVRLAPHAPAVTAPGVAALGFGELEARANRLARHLRELGIGPEARVGLLLEREPEMVVSLLAVLKAGGAYVPLDTGQPAERLRFLIQDAGLSALVTRERLLPAEPGVRAVLIDPAGAEAAAIAARADSPPPRPAGSAHAAYVIYTSGSTGRPKGVVITHRGLVNYLCWAQAAYGASPERGAPVHSSLGFDLTITSLFVPLLAGAAIHLLPEEDGIAALAAALRGENGFGLAKITPAHLGLLRRLTPEGEAPPSAACLVVGGDALWAADVAPWLRDGVRIFNEYGPTETVVGCCVHEVDPAAGGSGAIPIGRPIANTRLYVMSPGRQPVPAGVPGELWIGGDGVARGYLGRPELTAERFVPDPFAGPEQAGGRLYRSGDLVRLSTPGPGLEYLGRIDDQVKIRGHRIEPGEVAAALAAHPGLRDAAVALRGTGDDRRLVAWVVPRDRARRPGGAELRAFLAERLPAPMIPAVFVPLDVLPLTANGKLDRRALPEPEAQGDHETPYAPPRTPTEEALAEVWSQVLGVDRVGIDDHFFSLGGDSIRSLQVLALAQKRGLTVTPQDLFQRPTIRALAGQIRPGGGAGEARAAGEPFSLVAPADRRRLPDDVEDAYPLARLQAGMLFHGELDPGSAVYHDQHSFHVRAAFSPERLREAVDQISRLHPVLRTSFDFTSYSEPLQLVHRSIRIPIEVGDLLRTPSTDRDTALAQWLQHERSRAFSWEQPPLLRFHVHPGEEGSFQLTLSFHHAILDGWSAASLLTDLLRRYALLLRGEQPPADLPLGVTYRDFVALEGAAAAAEEARAFWRRMLDGAEPARLPHRAAPAGGGARSGAREIHHRIERELSTAARRVAREAEVPLKSLLLAVHLRVAGSLGGTRDVLTGLVSHGRPEHAEGERLLGLFLNTLPFRLQLGGGTWRELAREAFALETRMLPFRHFPLADLRDAARSLPSLEIAFNYLHYHVYAQAGAVRDIEVLGYHGYEETNVPLITHAILDPFSQDLQLGVAYRAADLDAAEAERYAAYLLRALTALVADPAARYDAAVLLSAGEIAQVLDGAADEGGSPPAAPPDRRFAAQASRTPDATALVGSGWQISYGALAAAVHRLARRLRRLGVGPEVRVGVCAARSPRLVAALLAVLKAGGAYVPLDPTYPRERLAYMLADAGAAVLLTEERLLGILPAATPQVVLLEAIDHAATEEDAGPDGADAPEDLPESLAYLIYTSGSTGHPKGVAITRGAAAALVAWAAAAFSREDLAAVAATTSICFDLSVFELFVPLSCGGTVLLADDALALARPQEAPLFARATLLNTVPSAAAELVRMGALPGGLRVANLAGEPLPRALADRMHAAGVARVCNLYGPSEDTTYSTFARVPPGDSRPPAIGRAIAGGRVRLLDGWLQPVPPGVAGEVFLGGAGVARGYLGRPDLTAARFLPDPWSGLPGDRLYRTGDLARLRAEEGELEFLGRIDHQVKIRGFRIEPGEIEAALAAQPGVRKAAVVVRADTPGDPRLIAYLVGEVAADALRRSLHERLPEALVPAAFVILADLPLTPNGKLDRKALPAPEWQPAETGYLAPRTPVEEILAGIWADVLGLARVGAADHFFDLGGHSLLATRVVSRLRSVFGIEMPLRDLFEAPRLARLAERVEAARQAGAHPRTPPLVALPRQEPAPLSFAQQRLWFIDQLDPAGSLYNMPVALRVEGPLHPGALALCLGEIVRRHETLRTVFAAAEGSPVQKIQPAVPFALPLVDLAGLPDGRREEQALALAGDEAGRPFDLRRGPLLRGLLLRLAGGDHVVALTLHHIAGDGWSLGLLVREVTAFYPALCEGRTAAVPELPLQYADFAAWQTSWLQGEVLDGELAFWRRRLAGLPPLLELPTDRPRPAVQSFRGGVRPVRLPGHLLRQARALCRQEGTTLFMVLLAGFQALLARSSGQDDLAVGTPVAGRNRVEIEDLIGCFVNTLVLRGDLAGQPSFRELLGRVRETTLEAHLHQDLPFEKLVEELAPRRSLGHTPLFQVMLALQNAPAEALEIRDLRLRPVAAATPSARFDLALNLAEHDGELGGLLEYATELFDRTTVDRLAGHFVRLLAAALEVQERATAELPLLTEAEAHQLQTEWNDTAVPAAPGVVERFEAQARHTPGSVAVVLAGDAGSALTYGELDRRADLLAGRLCALGVGPGVPVGLCVEQAPELAVGVLAIFKAGGTLLALDPAQPGARQSLVLEDAAPRVLVTRPDLLPSLPHHGAEIVLLHDGETAAGGPPYPRRTAGPAPGDLAYLIYTSGTAGRPKAVQVEHGSLAATLAATRSLFRFTADDRMPCLARATFDISLFELLSPLLCGGTAVFFPHRPALDPEHLVDRLGELTCLHAVPALMRSLLAALRQRGADAPDVARMRAVFTGGDSVPAELLEDLRAVFPAARVWVLYGPTEGTILCSAFPVPPPPAPARPLLGRPLAGAVLQVCDAGGGPLPPGVAGELWIGGTGVTRGYLGLPGLTAEKYVPRGPGRFYRSGDRARRLADGTLEFLGRLDQQIKIRGFRIEPEEIEAALATLPGVREAVVVARAEGPDGDRRLVAYVTGDVPRRTAEDLRAALRERLPDYMVPAACVVLDALPLTRHGKVDRLALPAPESSSGEAAGVAAPSDPVEEVLAGIWAEVLRRDRVGVHEDFFALGGHSLLATQVVSRLRAALDVELPLRRLFEAPTVAQLARAVRAERESRPAPPIAPVPRGGELPLSFAQQRLWLIDRLEPGNPAYNVPFAVRLSGELAVPLLERVFAEVVRRQEVLRTNVLAERPVQVVAPPGVPPQLPVIDLAQLPETVRQEAARALAREEARRPFDLQDDPLLRLRLVRLGETDHLLLLTLHHIVSDGWSVGVLLREIAALTAAFARGLPSPLPELPLQYADFAVWQRGWLQGEVLAAAIEAWKRRLAGAPQILRLPLDRPRPPAPSFRGALRRRTLPPPLAAAVHALCRREGLTPFMALLAAWAVLLGRLADQEDLLVGFPIAGRNRREIEDLIGFFVNTLVLRCDLAGNPSWRGLLGRVRRTVFDAFTHQELPFERLVEEVAEERDLAVPPLIQTMLILQNAPHREAEPLPGLSLSPVEVDPGSAKLDLTLALAESPAGFAASLEFGTDLFDAATADRLIDRFAVLLAAAVDDPGRPLADLPLLPPAERSQLAAWSTAARESPPGEPIHRRFERQAAQTPGATALVAPGRRMSYGELDAAANRLARHLRGHLLAQGAGPEARVALLLERSVDLVVALLAALKAGASYLPLDPAYPAQRLADLLADSAAAVLVTHGSVDAALPSSAVRIVHLDADRAEIAAHPAGALGGAGVPESLAYVIFTSGSTGRPKGVMVAHDGLCNLAHAQIRFFGVRPGDRVLQLASPGFDASVSEIWMALLGGAELHLADPQSLLPGPDLLAVLQERRVTHLTISPSVLAALPAGELPDLAALVMAGEACPPDLVRLWRRTGRRLFNAYGPTEGTVCATMARLDAEDGERLPIGKPLAGARVLILDRHLTEAPIGAPGEICLGGAGLARGYLGQPGLTAGRFRPDPSGSAPGARLYHTGDLGRFRADGALEFLGRLDDQIKLRGIRIEPGEIRAVLLEHPAVREAAVIPRTDTPGGSRLIAYVVPRTGEPVAPGALREFLRRRLPDFLVPAAFVPLDELPLTPHGKLDRRALPDPGAAADRAATFVAPRTPDEEILAGLWAELLGLDRVGADDDFFALGGHSLLATQVTSRLREALGVELPLRRLFEAPTVAGLAQAAREAGAGAPPAPPLVRLARGGDLPLSFAQRRLWLLDQIEPGNATYNIPLALRLGGRVAPGELVEVFTEIVRRHEVLRTTFAAGDGEPTQVIGAAVRCALPVLDLSQLPADRRAEQAQALALEETHRPFDLRRGPLLRLGLVRLAEQDHLLLLTLHHIAADGWSLGVLLREVEALLAAFRRGLPSPLPELPLQYADFALWQRSWLQGEVLATQLAAWKQRLAGAPRLLELPTDRPRPPARTWRGQALAVDLEPSLSAALHALCRRQAATPFMALLAAWAVLLGRLAGQQDVLIGSPIANRNRREVEDLIGFFVNTLVFRVDLAEAPSFDALLGRVRQTALDAFTHQDLPFERLVEELGIERDLAVSPLFQATFLLQNTPQRPAALPGLSLAPVEVASGLTKFDLTLALAEGPSGFAGWLEVSTDLFDGATARRWLQAFRTLLEGIVAEPARRPAELPLLGEAERAQLLVEWNDTRTAGAAPESVVERFAAQAARTPAATALVWRPADGAEVRLTYRELDRAANRLAHRLRAAGVRTETRVALLAERSAELVIGLLGILKAGGAYLPLDPAYPDERLRFLLEDSGASVRVAPSHQLDRLAGPGVTVPLLDPRGDEGSDHDPGHRPRPGDLAYMIYTSGTAGAPKAVMVEHGNLAHTLRATRDAFGFGPADRMPCLAPFSFDIFLFELFSPLLSGGTSVLVDLRPVPDVDRLAAELEEATLLHAVPALMRQIVEAVARRPGTAERHARLRGIFVGGDAVPPELLADLRRSFPGARIQVLYGPTETTILATHHAVGGGDDRTWIGRPFADTVIRLCDPEGRPVPIGVAGEIWIGGAGVSRGYWKRDELTAERFVTVAGERFFRTGDRARLLPDGSLVFLGRADQQVKVRGFRIEPGEVEAALLRLPPVRACAVLAREDRRGDRRLVAYVVLHDGADDPAEPVEVRLRAGLAQSLPEWMIPSRFVVLGELPLSAHGKVDRAALPALEPERTAGGAAPAAPEGTVEAALAAIWAEVLGIGQVGLDDNFFTLGGDSILSIQVAARAQRAGLEVTSRLVFLHQTVAQLAAAVRDLMRDQARESADPGPAAGPLPLTPIQHRFFAGEPVDPHHFNQSVLLEETRPLPPRRLAAALALVCAHHEALWLRFRRGPDGWEQEGLLPAEGSPLAVVDLAALPAEARGPALEAAAAAVQTSLDLGRGPLHRVVLFAHGEESPGRLLWVIHHLAVDGVSWRVLLGDLAAACADLEAGRPARLPNRTAPFQRWAERLAEEARAAGTQAEIGFWRKQRSPEVPRLPRDWTAAPGANTLASQRSASLQLDPEETQALLQEVPKVYNTRINDALLAALALAFQEWTGSPLLLVDLEGHGREDLFPDLDLTRTVGWFTSVHPVLLDLRGVQGVGGALKQVKEQLRSIPRGGVGYGLLETGGAAGRFAGLPEPEVGFNYLGQLDQVFSTGLPFRLARESAGRERSPLSRRSHLLEFQGSIFTGRLSLACLYSASVHRPAGIERLVALLARSLRDLIDHCRAPEAGGLTPSDFPLAGLTQAQLDSILGRGRNR